MNKLLITSCLGLVSLSLSACQQLVETPAEGQQQVVNPLGFLSQPLATDSTTTTTTTEKKPRLANGRKNFGTSTTTTTTTSVVKPTAPVQTATIQSTNQQVVGSQAIQVQTADGRSIILYPGQTYYGPDGRLYVYDPNSLPVVTSGF